MSEALVGFFAHLVEHVVATGAPLCVMDLFEHPDREGIDALRRLGLVHVLRVTTTRGLTWIWPTRVGCHRFRRSELALPTAELLEHLQAEMRQKRRFAISLAGAAEAAGWDATAIPLPLLLLHHTAHAAIVPLTPDTFHLHIYDVEGFLAFDANELRKVSERAAHVQTAAELRLRYADGERDFGIVVANEQDFRGADLDDVVIEHGTLRGADFRGASLRGARLGASPATRLRLASGVELFGLDLGAADFGGVDLEGADLRGADLTDARLDGARFDARTQIPELSLSRAKWELVYRDGEVIRRNDWGNGRREAPPDPEFSLAPDRSGETWTVMRGEVELKTGVKDSGGIRLCALLMANATRSIHALDAHAALTRVPPRLGPLGELEYESGDVTARLKALGLSDVPDAKPDVAHRLRACLRERDRIGEPERSRLLAQMKAELKHRRLNLTKMAYVQNVVNKLRKQAERGMEALAGDTLQPLVSAIEIGEFFSYRRA